MIQVSLPQLIMIYLAIIIGGMFVLWIGTEVARRFRSRKLRRFQVVCGVCGCHFEDRSSELLPLCPECGRPNERDHVSEI